MATAISRVGCKYGWPGFIVPADMLRDALLARARTAARTDIVHQTDFGWQETASQRAAVITGKSSKAITRRLFEVLSGRAKAINAPLAEALLLGLGACMEHETDIPTLPGCRGSATEMVEVWNELHGSEMTPTEQHVLARSLFNFSVGFLHALDLMEPAEVEAEEAELEAVA